MKGFLEGFLFRPQGKPMAYPYTTSAKISQYPWRVFWNESFIPRFWVGVTIFLMVPALLKVDQKLTGPENTAYWIEKRKKDIEHERHHIEKMWEVRT